MDVFFPWREYSATFNHLRTLFRLYFIHVKPRHRLRVSPYELLLVSHLCYCYYCRSPFRPTSSSFMVHGDSSLQGPCFSRCLSPRVSHFQMLLAVLGPMKLCPFFRCPDTWFCLCSCCQVPGAGSCTCWTLDTCMSLPLQFMLELLVICCTLTVPGLICHG